MTSNPYFNPIQTSLKPSSTGFQFPCLNPFFPTSLESFPFPARRYKHRIFGPSRAGELASRHGIAAVAALPIDPEYAKAVDLGAVEKLDAPSLDVILDAVLAP